MELSCLLAELADGDFHSGEELGVALGVSRTAIWKQLQKLDEVGLKIAILHFFFLQEFFIKRMVSVSIN